jgi:hypothetical protein
VAAGIATLLQFGVLATKTDALRPFLGFRITVMEGVEDVSSTGCRFAKGLVVDAPE